MNKIKKGSNLEKQSAKVLAKVSLGLGKAAVNGACCYIYHQPKMPESLKEMKKF